jgi:hypothetical protein
MPARGHGRSGCSIAPSAHEGARLWYPHRPPSIPKARWRKREFRWTPAGRRSLRGASAFLSRALVGVAEGKASVEARDFEQVLDRPLGWGQRVVALMPFAQQPAAKEGVQPFGVHELDAPKIEYHLLGSHGTSLRHDFIEHLGGDYVELAVQGERIAVALSACGDAQSVSTAPGRRGRFVAEGDALNGLLLAHQAPGAVIACRPPIGGRHPAVEALQSEHVLVPNPWLRAYPERFQSKRTPTYRPICAYAQPTNQAGREPLASARASPVAPMSSRARRLRSSTGSPARAHGWSGALTRRRTCRARGQRPVEPTGRCPPDA